MQTTILLADDDREDQLFFAEAFLSADSQIKIHTVDNGKQAIEFLNNCPDGDLPSLIVLDYNMPELNGAEVLDEISTNPRFNTIPKIILSTSSSPEYMRTSFEKGARKYFVKPFSMQEFKHIATQMLGLVDSQV